MKRTMRKSIDDKILSNYRIKYTIIIFCFVLMVLINWIFNIIYGIKNARIFSKVKVQIEGFSSNELNLIEIYRISPRDNLIKMKSISAADKLKKYWVSGNYGFFKSMQITFPHEEYVAKNFSITIFIEDKTFLFTNVEFLKSWEKVKKVRKDKVVVFRLPDGVGDKASIIPFFNNNIINWIGDIEILLISFDVWFFCFFLLILLVILFDDLYINYFVNEKK